MALGRCLVSGSPGALRARAILNGEAWYLAWGGLLSSVRTGDTAFDNIIGAPFFEHLAANPELALVFDEAMTSSTQSAARAVTHAFDFARNTVVDVGGGTGALLTGIQRDNPRARGILFDQPSVVADAHEAFGQRRGRKPMRGDRRELLRVGARGGDVYILSWVIHDWDDENSVTILKNRRQAMKGRARLLVIEQVVPPGNEPSLSKL